MHFSLALKHSHLLVWHLLCPEQPHLRKMKWNQYILLSNVSRAASVFFSSASVFLELFQLVNKIFACGKHKWCSMQYFFIMKAFCHFIFQKIPSEGDLDFKLKTKSNHQLNWIYEHSFSSQNTLWSPKCSLLECLFFKPRIRCRAKSSVTFTFKPFKHSAGILSHLPHIWSCKAFRVAKGIFAMHERVKNPFHIYKKSLLKSNWILKRAKW